MPESACLHIQQAGDGPGPGEGSGPGPVRVVDLRAGVPVRIGRAAYCDVRLSEPELANEECRLRRRGQSWQLVPIADRGSVRLDGRAVEGPTVLSVGMTFEVGPHRLTLRESPTSSPWADRPAPTPSAAVPPGRDPSAPRLDDRPPPADTPDRWERSRKDARRWEARWRAAGESLRAGTSTATTTAPTATLPTRPSAPTVEPGGMVSSPAGYVPPSAPVSRRSPSGLSAWASPDVGPRPAPAEAPRVRRPEPPASPARSAEVGVPPVELRAPRPRNRVSAPATPLRGIDPPRRDLETDPGRVEDAVSDAGPSTQILFHEEGGGQESSLLPFVEEGPVKDCLSRDEDVADGIPGVAPKPVEPALASVIGTEPTGLVAPHGEHVELANVDFEALIHRLQALILSEVEDARPVGTGVDLPPPNAPFEDDDEGRDAEPESTKPVLGSAHRGTRGSRAEAHPSSGRGPSGGRIGPAPAVHDRPPGRVETTVFRAGTPPQPSHTEGGGGQRFGIPPFDQPSSVSGFRIEPDSPGSGPSREWPTVREILAAHGVRPSASERQTTRKGRPARPEPTVSREPGHWRLPLWLGWLPGASAALGVGLAGMAGAWAWSVDGYNAGVVAQRLADSGPLSRSPMPEGVGPGEGSWLTTTAPHLSQWAAYLDRAADNIPSSARESRSLLGRAAGVAPLNPTVRYALARPLPGEPASPSQSLARALGQSRDVPALARAGRGLLAAGKHDAALRAFAEALEMAARADVARLGAPGFPDDPQARRYVLPGEDLLAAVVREMAGVDTWSYKDWSSALPLGTAAPVVAARVLRETGSPDARAALDAALAGADAAADAAAPPLPPAAEALRLASGAEALAMAQRWGEARDRYRRAVERMPVEPVRRAWWFNIADLASRLDDDPDRQKALEAAKVSDLKDEITRRVVDLQRASGPVARRSVSRVAGSEARR